MLQALIFHHEDDPMCWHIDNQYYFGNSFLVAPIMNDDGVRDVCLPAGKWIDFWTGEVLEGNHWLKKNQDVIGAYASVGQVWNSSAGLSAPRSVHR